MEVILSCVRFMVMHIEKQHMALANAYLLNER